MRRRRRLEIALSCDFLGFLSDFGPRAMLFHVALNFCESSQRCQETGGWNDGSMS